MIFFSLGFIAAASKAEDQITTDAMRPSRGSDIGAAENETHCCFSSFITGSKMKETDPAERGRAAQR